MTYFPEETDAWIQLSLDDVLNDRVDPDRHGDWETTRARWNYFRTLTALLSPALPEGAIYQVRCFPGQTPGYMIKFRTGAISDRATLFVTQGSVIGVVSRKITERRTQDVFYESTELGSDDPFPIEKFIEALQHIGDHLE